MVRVVPSTDIYQLVTRAESCLLVFRLPGFPDKQLTRSSICRKLRSVESDNPILIVEDSEHDLFFMRYAFREAGVKNRVVELRDGQQAINYLSGKGEFCDRVRFPLPCLIITDLKMPVVDGFGLLKWLSAQPDFDRVPKIILSSSGEQVDRKRAAELGSCAYFVKPGGIKDLVQVVKHLDSTWIAEHCPLK